MKLFISLILLLTKTSINFATEPNNTSIHAENDIAALPPRTRITNGYPQQHGSVPYIVYLISRYGDGQLQDCGGSIIGHNWVLTAAHCTDDAIEIDVHYGSVNRKEPLYKHTIQSANIVQHKYYPEEGYDISLIRTPYVIFSNAVKKIDLPTLSDRYKSLVNRFAKACGWGRNNDVQGSEPDDILQCIFLPIISRDTCALTYGSVAPKILCTSTHFGQSTCVGDSGGPLVESDRLVGVSSFNNEAGCMIGSPVGFVRVSGHLQWIKYHTGIHYE